ncbi:hypothetical protein [Blastococcus sp. CT_GayMR16]|uniref:hypothetical protein n=1 Tax=Blastococcus sp. CT_GayMR16 TaxID=2559607 RepID=UPI001073EFDC|nr:hypothetical protein [Blastococcus sp. CT_GayMR16]TFV83459.1 hypothetical protein E4P38_20075 [Blastococcus sp. CT_GayMR16]
MKLTFRRMADRRPVETLVERDDGVAFTMRGAGGGSDLPHDLAHAVVERQLGVDDGIWGCVADGVVWRSMTHLSGRRPPHAAERSDRLKRERSASVQRAERLADLVGRLASGADVLPGEIPATGKPPAALAAAAAELRDVQRRWAGLTVGEIWVVEWGVVRGRSGRR